MNSDNFDSAFFAAEMAAEATVDELYKRAAQERNASVAIATVALAATSVAVVAAWRSELGRKVRNKIAEAIKAE